MTEKNAVRTAAVTVTTLSLVLPVFMAVPTRLPATAMGSVALLYFERLAAVFAILLLLLVFLYRSLVHGELPRAVSGRGAEWPDSVATTDSLQRQLDEVVAVIRAAREGSAEAGR